MWTPAPAASSHQHQQQQHLLDLDPITQYPDDREMHFYYLHINSIVAIWQKYHIAIGYLYMKFIIELCPLSIISYDGGTARCWCW